jgi:hypothetical protein
VARFLRSKARRLLLPMLIVGTLYAVLQAQGLGTNVARFEWRTLHVEPVDHFWFVESLFWVFLIIGGLEWADRRNSSEGREFRWLSHPAGLAAVWAASMVLQLSVDLPRALGLEGASYLLPYFIAGLATARPGVQSVLGSPRGRVALALAAILAVALLEPVHPNPDRRTWTMLAAGTVLCLLCVSLRPRVEFLARIGMGSYVIYLMHVFFTASARLAMHRVGVDAVGPNFAVGLACGLAGPLMLQALVHRSRWASLLVLGESLQPRRSGIALQAVHP